MKNKRSSIRVSPRSSGKTVVTWGIFLQSDGTLLDTAKARIGAVSKLRAMRVPAGYAYIDSIVLP